MQASELNPYGASPLRPDALPWNLVMVQPRSVPDSSVGIMFQAWFRLAHVATGDIVRHWRKLLVLQLILQGTSVVVLGPAVMALLQALVGRGDAVAMGNTAIIDFGSSLTGLLVFTLLPASLLTIAFVEQSCTLALLHSPSDGIRGAIARAIGRAPALARLALRQFLIAAAGLVPVVLAGVAVYALLLRDADINYYLEHRPLKFLIAVGIGAVLALLAISWVVWLIFRWFLSVPFVLLESRSPMDALRASARSARPLRGTVVGAVAIWLAVRIGAAVAVGLMVALATPLALRMGGSDIHTLALATGAVLAANSALLIAAAALDSSIGGALMLETFCRATGVLGDSRTVPHAADPPVATVRRRLLVLLGMTAAVTAAGAYALHESAGMFYRQRVTIVAHCAGAAYAPENSLAALRLAMEQGADAAEIDVQLSADGTVFVAHDRDLLRVAGVPMVISKSHDVALRDVDIGVLSGNNWRGEHLATLKQFIETAGDRIRLSIELKYYGPEPRLVKAVIDVIHDENAGGRCEIISLDDNALAQARLIDSTIRLGYLVFASLGDITRMNVDFLSVNKSLLKQSLRVRAQRHAMKLAVWTVNNRDEMLQMMAAGADELVTDDVVLARGAVSDYKSLSDTELLLLRWRQALK